MTEPLVEQFHKQIVELVKKYQFRDRNRMCGVNLSVSQSYILEALNDSGPLTMKELAQRMYISVSTTTRVVDQLVKKDYVRRGEDQQDRRVKRITLTDAGRQIYMKTWASVVESEVEILHSMPESQREATVQFLKKLNQAVDNWRNKIRC